MPISKSHFEKFTLTRSRIPFFDRHQVDASVDGLCPPRPLGGGCPDLSLSAVGPQLALDPWLPPWQWPAHGAAVSIKSNVMLCSARPDSVNVSADPGQETALEVSLISCGL